MIDSFFNNELSDRWLVDLQIGLLVKVVLVQLVVAGFSYGEGDDWCVGQVSVFIPELSLSISFLLGQPLF